MEQISLHNNGDDFPCSRAYDIEHTGKDAFQRTKPFQSKMLK